MVSAKNILPEKVRKWWQIECTTKQCKKPKRLKRAKKIQKSDIKFKNVTENATKGKLSRHYSLSWKNSLQFCKDFTPDKIFLYTNIVGTLVRFYISWDGKLSLSPVDVRPFLFYLHPFEKSSPLPSSIFFLFFVLSELTKVLHLWFLILDDVLASVFSETYSFLAHCCSLWKVQIFWRSIFCMINGKAVHRTVLTTPSLSTT